MRSWIINNNILKNNLVVSSLILILLIPFLYITFFYLNLYTFVTIAILSLLFSLAALKYRFLLPTTFLILPFLPALSFLNTQDINYSAYFSIVVTLFTIVLIISKPKIKFDGYLLYWGWFLVVLFISWPVSYIIKNYTFINLSFGSYFSLYIA